MPLPPPPPAIASARTPQGAERESVFDAVRPDVERQLGKPVRFKARRLRIADNWAFVDARMQAPDGGDFSYAGTPRAEDARQGLVSHAYAALLQRDGQSWTIVAQAIGPTDVPWEGWAQLYGAPSSLFAP